MIGGSKQQTDKSEFSRSFPWVLAETTKTNYRDQILVLISNRDAALRNKSSERRVRVNIICITDCITVCVYQNQATHKQSNQHNTGSHHQTDQQWPRRPTFSAFALIFFQVICVFIFKVQQLWEIGPSCQHFDMIKECVNQREAQAPQKWNPRLLFPPQSGPLPRDSFPLDPDPRRKNYPAPLTFVVFRKRHESVGPSETARSWSPFDCSCSRLQTLAWQLRGRPDLVGFFFYFISNYSWIRWVGGGCCRFWRVVKLNFCHKCDVTSARDSSAQEDQKYINIKGSLVYLEFIFAPVKENLLQNSIIFLGVNAWDQKDHWLVGK